MTKSQKLLLSLYDNSARLTNHNKIYVAQFVSFFRWMFQADEADHDITTAKLIPMLGQFDVNAEIIAQATGIVSGMAEIDYFVNGRGGFEFQVKAKDGSQTHQGHVIATLKGNYSRILAHKRLILNVLQRMSSIATNTHELIKNHRLANIRIKNSISHLPFIAATRKTPWMWLDKKAVAIGGGLTHRLSLGQSILVKKNHLDIIRKAFPELSPDEAIQKYLDSVKKTKEPVEIEVTSPIEALSTVSDYLKYPYPNALFIMLDNFTVLTAKQTIAKIRHLARDKKKPIFIELSGGIKNKNLAQYVSLGADVLSLSQLTNPPRPFDAALRVT